MDELNNNFIEGEFKSETTESEPESNEAEETEAEVTEAAGENAEAIGTEARESEQTAANPATEEKISQPDEETAKPQPQPQPEPEPQPETSTAHKKPIEKSDRTGQAVTSLVLGIISLFVFVFGLFGVILSAIGLGLGISAVRKTDRNAGIAKGGIATSAIGLALSMIVFGATTCMFLFIADAFSGLTDGGSNYTFEYPIEPGAGDIFGDDIWGFENPIFGNPGYGNLLPDDGNPDDKEKDKDDSSEKNNKDNYV